MRDRRPREGRGGHALAAVLLALTFIAPRLPAQAGLGQVEDATTVPKGLLRLRAIATWTRYDARFTASGVQPLGAPFTADSLGSNRFPELLDAEARIRSALQSTGAAPFALSLGRSRLDATAREEVIPLTLEYGVTNRFAVGVTMPVIRKRVAVQFRLDTAGGFVANVGPNVHRTNPAAAQNNALVQTQFASAIARLQACVDNPAAPGCSATQGRQAEAQQLIQLSQLFAADVGAVYGTAAASGAAFVPINGSAAQTAIALRVAAFNALYRELLGSTTDVIQAVPTAAGGPAGVSEFQRYLTEELGRDSLATQEREGVGDVEIGFKLRVLDLPRTEFRRAGVQLAVASALRFPSGSRQSVSDLADLRTGGGSIVVDSRAILDARAGRFGLLASGLFAASVRDVDTTNLAMRNSQWTEVHVAPRWHFSEPFAIHGAYSLRSTDKLGGDQLAGGGVSFTTLANYTGGLLPVEMRFTHLEAISGDAGRPKFFRDQLEVRIYYRRLKR